MRSSSTQFKLPKPCPKQWSEMTPSGEGRHCNSCDRIVVDFTGKSAEEIRDHLMANSYTCGHIEAAKIVQHRTPRIKSFLRRMKYAAAICSMLGFGFSAEAQIDAVSGKPLKPMTLTVPRPEAAPADVKMKEPRHRRTRRHFWKRRKRNKMVVGRFVGYMEIEWDGDGKS